MSKEQEYGKVGELINWRQYLEKEQIKAITSYVNQQYQAGKGVLDTETIKGLKEICRKWHNELLAKGLLDDYLAYVIAYEASLNQQNKDMFEAWVKKR